MPSMRPSQLKEYVARRPFLPLRLYVSDGSYYDVRHPEAVMITQHDVGIGLGWTAEGLPERSRWIDPLHVTRVEIIDEGQAQPAE